MQSGVLLALHRLEHKAAQTPDVQFILAVEEPEAFLHPQKQKELYQNIRSVQSDNLKVIVTTHSPYVVSETPFTKLGLVRRDGQHSVLHVADVKDEGERETFDAYSDDVNALLFFADKVVFVEGESDARVIKHLLEKKLGAAAHRISVISAAGNQNFSPFLRMIRAWTTAKLPHLVVTDFDSLTKSTDRAIMVGAKAAGYKLPDEPALHVQVDTALDKGEAEFAAAASAARVQFAAAGLNVFVFTSDMEFSLLTQANKDAVALLLNEIGGTRADYRTGYDINQIRRHLGSKGVPLNAIEKPPFKKPYVHRKIAATIDLSSAHPDIVNLLNAIETM